MEHCPASDLRCGHCGEGLYNVSQRNDSREEPGEGLASVLLEAPLDRPSCQLPLPVILTSPALFEAVLNCLIPSVLLLHPKVI